MPSWIDQTAHDVCVAFDDEVPMPAAKAKRLPLSEKVHAPSVAASKKAKSSPIEIKLKFTQQEFRTLCGTLDVDRPNGDDRAAKNNLAEAVKSHLLSL